MRAEEEGEEVLDEPAKGKKKEEEGGVVRKVYVKEAKELGRDFHERQAMESQGPLRLGKWGMRHRRSHKMHETRL